MNEELYHYGIKRRSGRYPWGSGQRPFQGLENITFAGQNRNSDIRISKGTTAYRLQSKSDLRKSGPVYVSMLKTGHFDYIKDTAAQGPGALPINLYDENNKLHSIRLKVNEDLIAPSYQKAFEAFVDTVDALGGPKKAGKDLFANFNETDRKKGETFIKNYKNMKLSECREAAYKAFNAALMKDSKGRQIFFDILEKQGYNAIVDDNDADFNKPGTYRENTAPLLIFDVSNVKQTKDVVIDDKSVSYLRDLYYRGAEHMYDTNDEDDIDAKKEAQYYNKEGYEAWKKKEKEI